MKLKIYGEGDPNMTVLMPGQCNASCAFCFWNRNEAKIKSPADFCRTVLDDIFMSPDMFRTLSISGGEPTLSPMLREFLLDLIIHRIQNPVKLKRVVLTTNGSRLEDYIALLRGSVDYVNISRHAIDDAENALIFKTFEVPSASRLEALIDRIQREANLSVTLNCVIDEQYSGKKVVDFVKWARSIGADAVSFRVQAKRSKLAESVALEYFNKHYAANVVGTSDCGVCKGVSFRFANIAVNFKTSTIEPSKDTGMIYELVWHPDGSVYADWNRKVCLDGKLDRVLAATIPLQQVVAKSKQSLSRYASGMNSVQKVVYQSEDGGCRGGGGCR